VVTLYGVETVYSTSGNLVQMPKYRLWLLGFEVFCIMYNVFYIYFVCKFNYFTWTRYYRVCVLLILMYAKAQICLRVYTCIKSWIFAIVCWFALYCSVFPSHQSLPTKCQFLGAGMGISGDWVNPSPNPLKIIPANPH
jgi:hypothetical protein